jgi:hypothetical protein
MMYPPFLQRLLHFAQPKSKNQTNGKNKNNNNNNNNNPSVYRLPLNG